MWQQVMIIPSHVIQYSVVNAGSQCFVFLCHEEKPRPIRREDNAGIMPVAKESPMYVSIVSLGF